MSELVQKLLATSFLSLWEQRCHHICELCYTISFANRCTAPYYRCDPSHYSGQVWHTQFRNGSHIASGKIIRVNDYVIKALFCKLDILIGYLKCFDQKDGFGAAYVSTASVRKARVSVTFCGPYRAVPFNASDSTWLSDTIMDVIMCDLPYHNWPSPLWWRSHAGTICWASSFNPEQETWAICTVLLCCWAWLLLKNNVKMENAKNFPLR